MTGENDTLAEEEKPGYDSSDPKQVRDRRAVAGRRDARIKASYKALLAHQHGRELLWDLLTKCGIYQTSFRPGIAEQALSMAFLEGQRNIGLMLQADLVRADAVMYNKMREEHTNG